MMEINLSPGMLVVVLVLVVVVLQVCPDHHADTGHLLALLLHHQLTAAPVGHHEAHTVVLQNTADLNHIHIVRVKMCPCKGHFNESLSRRHLESFTKYSVFVLKFC